jgi:RimJ/RimL family protein N-acetyltransferase
MHKMLLDLPSQIETTRLTLRSYRAGDGPLLYAISQRNHNHLQRYEADNAILGVQSAEQGEILARELWAAWVGREYFVLAVFEKQKENFVAQVYIGPRNWETPEFEIGYIADVNHERQGYVSAAVRAALGMVFENLGARRASLHTDATNLRSQWVAERCGFVLEGRLRAQKLNPDGSFGDTLCYGLLRQEYERGKKNA